jgi:hypothetical protein
MSDRRKITSPERGGMRPSIYESHIRLSGLLRVAGRFASPLTPVSFTAIDRH